MDIIEAPVSAKALRLLAREIVALAQQIDCGQAEYLDGNFSFSIDRGSEEVPMGAFINGTRPSAGIAHLRADIRFREGLQKRRNPR